MSTNPNVVWKHADEAFKHADRAFAAADRAFEALHSTGKTSTFRSTTSTTFMPSSTAEMSPREAAAYERGRAHGALLTTAILLIAVFVGAVFAAVLHP